MYFKLSESFCFRAVRERHTEREGEGERDRESVRASVRDAWSYSRSLFALYLIKRLRTFHQMYYLGAVGDKDELVRFCG